MQQRTIARDGIKCANCGKVMPVGTAAYMLDRKWYHKSGSKNINAFRKLDLKTLRVLVGRWYRADHSKGPWNPRYVYVEKELPREYYERYGGLVRDWHDANALALAWFEKEYPQEKSSSVAARVKRNGAVAYAMRSFKIKSGPGAYELIILNTK